MRTERNSNLTHKLRIHASIIDMGTLGSNTNITIIHELRATLVVLLVELLLGLGEHQRRALQILDPLVRQSGDVTSALA